MPPFSLILIFGAAFGAMAAPAPGEMNAASAISLDTDVAFDASLASIAKTGSASVAKNGHASAAKNGPVAKNGPTSFSRKSGIWIDHDDKLQSAFIPCETDLRVEQVQHALADNCLKRAGLAAAQITLGNPNELQLDYLRAMIPTGPASALAPRDTSDEGSGAGVGMGGGDRGPTIIAGLTKVLMSEAAQVLEQRGALGAREKRLARMARDLDFPSGLLDKKPPPGSLKLPCHFAMDTMGGDFGECSGRDCKRRRIHKDHVVVYDPTKQRAELVSTVSVKRWLGNKQSMEHGLFGTGVGLVDMSKAGDDQKIEPPLLKSAVGATLASTAAALHDDHLSTRLVHQFVNSTSSWLRLRAPAPNKDPAPKPSQAHSQPSTSQSKPPPPPPAKTWPPATEHCSADALKSSIADCFQKRTGASDGVTLCNVNFGKCTRSDAAALPSLAAAAPPNASDATPLVSLASTAPPFRFPTLAWTAPPDGLLAPRLAGGAVLRYSALVAALDALAPHIATLRRDRAHLEERLKDPEYNVPYFADDVFGLMAAGMDAMAPYAALGRLGREKAAREASTGLMRAAKEQIDGVRDVCDRCMTAHKNWVDALEEGDLQKPREGAVQKVERERFNAYNDAMRKAEQGKAPE